MRYVVVAHLVRIEPITAYGTLDATFTYSTNARLFGDELRKLVFKGTSFLFLWFFFRVRLRVVLVGRIVLRIFLAFLALVYVLAHQECREPALAHGTGSLTGRAVVINVAAHFIIRDKSLAVLTLGTVLFDW
jgi:hypothetical protein